MRRAVPILLFSLSLPLVVASSASCSLLPDLTDSSASEVILCGEGGEAFRFETGGDGHPDPLGAIRAHQARAGRITKQSDIAQPADARSKIRIGDFLLANDKVAIYIEAEGKSDGYLPFGGEILGIEPVGQDGRPLGVSYYGEGAVLFGLEAVSPERVSVIADGSDGGPAIVRASGTLKMVPILDAFSAIFPDRYNLPAALDYVLEPGSPNITLRLNLANPGSNAVDFTDKQHVAFFQSSRSQTFSEVFGFGRPQGDLRFVGWDSGHAAFTGRNLLGPMSVALEISGIQIFKAPALTVDGCSTKTVDYMQLTGGAGGIDGALEMSRKALGDAAWHEVHGVVREDNGGVLGGAIVHATSPSGYLTRVTADDQGRFAIHVPTGGKVSLTPTMKGWAVPAATPLGADANQIALSLPQRATIDVDAVDADTGEALPVRIQIVPDQNTFHAPESFGLKDEPDNRLYREFVMSGHASLPVPPGGHRVIVTRGYDYELFDAPVSAQAGQTTHVRAALKRSVDSTGVMCADFHIHSFYSADSSDPVEKKVRGAIADGLEIPVSSEHEYVIDFQDTIRALGLTKWAFGMASEELTTFTYGHFGIVPLTPQPEGVNHGAIDWTGMKPPELFPTINRRPERPLIIVNHPEDSAMGYFALGGFDRTTTTGAPELWNEQFSAIEVFNESDFETNRNASVADWFALLNAGKIYWATGASDSHDLRSVPVGYPRTCIYFGHDDPTRLTPEAVRDGMRSGTAVISGGLTMTVQGPDGTLPGGTSQAGLYKVVIQSPGWISASGLEVIVDGVTQRDLNLPPPSGSGPGKRWELTVPVDAASSRSRHWVVFHARGSGDLSPLLAGKKPFAVSNPIFF
jgi:hypothetical protein